jgi:hypothetical protein
MRHLSGQETRMEGSGRLLTLISIDRNRQHFGRCSAWFKAFKTANHSAAQSCAFVACGCPSLHALRRQ